MGLEILEKYTSVKKLSLNKAEVTVCERGARLISLKIGGSPNLLWVNPALSKILKENEWNIGGLRVWISPERNFFYRKPEVFGEWFCPKTLDPNNYKFADSKEKAVLEGEIELKDMFTGEVLKGFIRREFSLEKASEEVVVYVKETLLTENSISTKVNLWALLQVVPPGTVVVPVKEGAEPIHYFKPIPSNRIKVTGEAVFFKIDGNYVCKLGVKPEDLPLPGCASIAYVSSLKDMWYCLILETRDAPLSQEECLDVAKYRPEGPRGCVQSYNSGPEGGPEKFGEIELQFRPAEEIRGCYASTVAYKLKAYIGDRDSVLNYLRKTLRVEQLTLL
ncbi:MAG: hypothetical protein DRN04_09165 [Thermoprotei archaeon]|nr:MAG: hypothetical protein DRN04_09165 [Thermoprotei archaeon]